MAAKQAKSFATRGCKSGIMRAVAASNAAHTCHYSGQVLMLLHLSHIACLCAPPFQLPLDLASRHNVACPLCVFNNVGCHRRSCWMTLVTAQAPIFTSTSNAKFPALSCTGESSAGSSCATLIACCAHACACVSHTYTQREWGGGSTVAHGLDHYPCAT